MLVTAEQIDFLRKTEEQLFSARERSFEQNLTAAERLKYLNEEAENLQDAANRKRKDATAAGGEKTSAGAKLSAALARTGARGIGPRRTA
jgi:hypothetical protein